MSALSDGTAAFVLRHFEGRSTRDQQVARTKANATTSSLRRQEKRVASNRSFSGTGLSA